MLAELTLDPHFPQATAAVALDAEHGMDNQVDGDLRPAEDDAQRIHQERHIVGDDHDERMRGLKAIAAAVRIEDLDERLTGTARETAKFQVIERCGGEYFRRSLARSSSATPRK